jgi:hypothetical protein
MKPAPFTLIRTDALGRVVHVEPLLFVPLRNVRPLNNAMLRRAGA